MKEKIIKLRNEGKTYNEIQKILGCSKSTISYHCGEGQKEKLRCRTKKLRSDNAVLQKVDAFKNGNKKLVANKSNDFQFNKVEKKYVLTFGWKDVVEKFGWQNECYLTGDFIDLSVPDSYALDHVIPRSKGGSNTLDNMGLTTKIANQVKSDLLLHELLELCIKILTKHGFKISKN
jgi:hypothetical protein